MTENKNTKKRYVGTKIIYAEPMTQNIFAASHGVPRDMIDKKGYLVKYENDYESWSPKAVFDAAYRLCDEMTFGLALEAMKKGLKVRLPHWAPDVYISLQSPDEHSKMTHPYLYVTSRYGMVPWISTVVEMFSEKWAISEQE